MAGITKQASTRFSIVKRSKGQSAVDKASYISRSILKSEYDGQSYRPKCHEDLVHSEISLPTHAPKEYGDRATLWNAVELAEKSQNAQLARMLKASLPNEWSYALAEEVVRDYVQRNFVDKGMCADWAIHDSENEKGERNLHIHVLLTMRPIMKDGTWGAKTKKEYLLDKKDLTDTINTTNEKLGIEVYWEHRSFREQGIEKQPTIHIGAVANALERKGIQTERGNINREIIRQNRKLKQAMEELVLANKELETIQSSYAETPATDGENEVLDMIAKVGKRKGRLDLPIVSGKHLRRISDRTALQSIANAETFIKARKIESFDALATFTTEKEQNYQQLENVQLSKWQRLNRLKELSKMYALYEPIQQTYQESQSLKGFAKMKYDREHKESLSKYSELRERMLSLLQQGEKITPKQWKAEIRSLQTEYEAIGKEKSTIATELPYAEVINYNKKNLERELQNESRQQSKVRSRQKTEEI